MNNIVDARGLSCLQPVILALNALKKATANEIIVLVDTSASMENVSRAAKSQGWQETSVQSENDGYKIILRKNA